MEMNIKNQLMTWKSRHNLNWLISFHNNVRGLFKDQLQELEKGEIKDGNYKLCKSALYDYDRIHHINTLLMMYSYLEEWLTDASKTTLVDRGGSLGRFKNVAEQSGVDLSSKLWQKLKNTEEVRNCLLHANGRVSLLKDPKKKINTYN